MPANAYPHLVFATDAQTLPRAELQGVVEQLFAAREPAVGVEQGSIQVVVRLGDYALTFWYDDDSEGLGERYAGFAPTLKRRRISRCTTMIDASGDADPDGAHAGDVAALMRALAQHPGVYVFSEEAKAFVGLDEEDPFAEPAPAAPAQVEPAAAQPAPAPIEPVQEQAQPVLAEPAHVEPAHVEPAHVEPEPVENHPQPALEVPVATVPTEPTEPTDVTGPTDLTGSAEPTEPSEPIEPTPAPAAEPAEPAAVAVEPEPESAPVVESVTSGTGAPVEPGPVEPEPAQAETTPVETAPVETAPVEPVEPEPAPTPAQADPAAAEPEKEGGFFKRLFGRRR